MEVAGYIAAAIMGITLGLIGGGGSILTVPVLVYLFNINPVLSTAYSLFIVGTVALAGAIGKIKSRHIDFKAAVVFAIPSFIAVFISRRYILPALPDVIATIKDIAITKDVAIMLLFALVMLIASISMIKGKKITDGEEQKNGFNYPVIILEGLIVGLITGIVGAGGGFLIIPALVLFAHIPMKMAVGTSLLIIAAKSLIGFTGDIAAGQEIDWNFLLIFTAIAIVGIFVGNYLNKFISNAILKKVFGYFVLGMSIFIIIKEII